MGVPVRRSITINRDVDSSSDTAGMVMPRACALGRSAAMLSSSTP